MVIGSLVVLSCPVSSPHPAPKVFTFPVLEHPLDVRLAQLILSFMKVYVSNARRILMLRGGGSISSTSMYTFSYSPQGYISVRR